MDTAIQNSSSANTALMKQYFELKQKYAEFILFFRVGDFYEMFDKDAVLASRELDITLTAKQDSGFENGKIAMAGVPAKSYEAYVAKLLQKGLSVAICEQIGQVGSSKGPVERAVVRIFTPGTITESQLLNSYENNYLACVAREGDLWALSIVDISCGSFHTCQMTQDKVVQEIARLKPKELLCKSTIVKDKELKIDKTVLEIPQMNTNSIKISPVNQFSFDFDRAYRKLTNFFAVSNLEGFGLKDKNLSVIACGVILDYIDKTFVNQKPYIPCISYYDTSNNMEIDSQTLNSLEILETLKDKKSRGSLLNAIDCTNTPMGARLLRKWLIRPLKNVEQIKLRHQVVQEIFNNKELREDLIRNFSQISDLERLSIKLAQATPNPKELLAIADSLDKLSFLTKINATVTNLYLKELTYLDDFVVELKTIINKALRPDAPRELTDGNIFNKTYDANIDKYLDLLENGQNWLNEYQEKEILNSGIKNLKVAYNRVFGYYIEVTNFNKNLVPKNYIRKQTLANAERYITEELKSFENKFLNAREKLCDLEYKLFVQLRDELKYFGKELLELANKIATVDVLTCFSQVASKNNYVMPIVDDSLVLNIKAGRHPVIEQLIGSNYYQPNDIDIEGDSNKCQLIVLTGPNMSGKSSYLRQIAHIVILAQIGCFVSAQFAHIGVVDKIFTRIGASDDVTSGQSTFLVEMSETTQCCVLSTQRSLILLDEVGRGTSTYDGVAIAYSVVEYLATQVKARTVFATHYHELNSLSNQYPQIANFQVLVSEQDNTIEFLHKVVPGSADKSYGIHVASMAGLPDVIIKRAKYLMQRMENKSAAGQILDNRTKTKKAKEENNSVIQLTLFDGLI